VRIYCGGKERTEQKSSRALIERLRQKQYSGGGDCDPTELKWQVGWGGGVSGDTSGL
jgi:PII-like signaling protein